MKKRNRILFSVILIVGLTLSVNFIYKQADFRLLENSIFTILKNFSEENTPEPPELSIEKVAALKISDPTDKFNYYRYKTTIIVHNYGGNLINGRLVIRGGDNQKHMLVKNTDEGFSLGKDDTYIIRGYEIVFDANYNGGQIPLYLDLVDRYDYFDENNYYDLAVFEGSAKIEDVSIKEVLDDGSFVVDFNEIPYSIRKHDFEILTSHSAYFENTNVRYDEVHVNDEPVGYYRIKNSYKNLADFDVYESENANLNYVKFPENSLVDGESNYLYVKATNPENGYYSISNLIHLLPQEEINRAQFSKLFVEKVELDIFDSGINLFDDVDQDEWYYPYVQTLYNYGLFDTGDFKFEPNEIISRGEVLRIVLNYFDVDLVADATSNFEDVSTNDRLHPFAEALYASGGGEVFDGYLYPEKPATKKYLNYLVNEFAKNN